MSCPSPIELSRALIAGVGDDLRDHLATCARCARELAAHGVVADVVRQLPIYQPSHDRARDLRGALLAAHVPAPVVMSRSRWAWIVGGTGALAAAAVIALVVSRPDATPSYRAELHPQPGAALARIGASPDEIVRLSDGSVTFEVATLDAGERFRVVTGDAEIEVRGTAFDVTADHDHLRSVRVLRGRVEVRAGTRTIILAAGERWEPQIARDEHILVAPTVAIAPTVAAPASSTPPPPRVPTPSPAPGHRYKSHRDAPTTGHVPAAPAMTTSQTTAAAATAPKRSIEVLFEHGWAMLSAGNATDAAATFERAARAAPGDPLAEDAWFWHASSLARAKSPAAAAAFDAFLAQYPKSPRTGEASAMLGWLVLDRDLDRAEKLFREASTDRVAAVRASATKGLANIARRRRSAPPER